MNMELRSGNIKGKQQVERKKGTQNGNENITKVQQHSLPNDDNQANQCGVDGQSILDQLCIQGQPNVDQPGIQGQPDINQRDNKEQPNLDQSDHKEQPKPDRRDNKERSNRDRRDNKEQPNRDQGGNKEQPNRDRRENKEQPNQEKLNLDQTVSHFRTCLLRAKQKTWPLIGNSRNTICTASLLVLVAMLIAVTLKRQTNQPTNRQESETVTENFTTRLRNIKTVFRNQDQHSWRILHTHVNRVLTDPYPGYPAIFLFVVPHTEDGTKTAVCLARKVAYAVDPTKDAEGFGYISCSNLNRSSVSEERKDLDDKLRAILLTKLGVIVDHVEQLSPFAMLLFHGYCDGDDAEYKKSVIIFIIQIQESREDLTRETLIDEYLYQTWTQGEGGMAEDKVNSLIARVASNKVVIKAEDVTMLKEQCSF